MSPYPPIPHAQAGQKALRALLDGFNPLAALQAIHHEMGDIFQIPLPGFKPVFLVGPEGNRFITVSHRDEVRWRSEGDPVTGLLREGLLVVDGEPHDQRRQEISPALHKKELAHYVSAMQARTDQVLSTWKSGQTVDMLVEMRKIALLILMDTLFGVDFSKDMERLLPAIHKTLHLISPGLWLIWPAAARFGSKSGPRELDEYFYALIRQRRAEPGERRDLIQGLLDAGLSDDCIRDQLLTLFIAGHDTSTAALAWNLYLLGSHPQVLEQVEQEIAAVVGQRVPSLEDIGQLNLLDRVIHEVLRLYPPIHLGNRIAAQDLSFNGYTIPAGTRVVYSIYLTHRHPQYWPQPDQFDPDRFLPENKSQRPPYTYLPFGAGPRNCIGLAFAQVEIKMVLVRILQSFKIALVEPKVRPYMGATLEPRPAVRMVLQQRNNKQVGS